MVLQSQNEKNTEELNPRGLFWVLFNVSDPFTESSHVFNEMHDSVGTPGVTEG